MITKENYPFSEPQKYTVNKNEYLEFTVEDLQYREKGWDRVHEDE